MKITCNYCGELVDINKYSSCPNCGASMADNDEYQQHVKKADELKERNRQLEYQKQQAEIQKRTLENERIRNQINTEKQSAKFTKNAKLGCLIPIIITVVLLCLGLAMSIFTDGKINDDSIPTTEPYVEPYHEVIAGETVQTRDYNVILDKWGYYKPNSYAIRDGEKYIKFHFTYTNTSEEKIYDNEQIYCYDSNGKSCRSQNSISDEDRLAGFKSQTVMPGKSYSGWIYFCIPEAATEVAIMYGERIEIKVLLNEDGELFDPGPIIQQYKANLGETFTTTVTEIVFDTWEYYEPTMAVGSGEKFIKIHATFTNIGTKTIDVYDRIPCYDANGAEYKSTTMFLQDSDKAQAIKSQEIDVNKSYSGWYYFEIPNTITEITIKPYSNVEIYVNLMGVAE